MIVKSVWFVLAAVLLGWPAFSATEAVRGSAPGAPTPMGLEAAPAELVLQVMEPSGGKILRPKEWFYQENHHGNSYVWTFSREDASKGPYITGFRIQAILRVQETTGKSSRDFVRDFVAGKKEQVDQVLRTCPEEKQGVFVRTCLEVEDGRDHILYSLFYGADDADAVVVTIAGTTRELWEIYAPTFDKMATFELVDMERLQE